MSKPRQIREWKADEHEPGQHSLVTGAWSDVDGYTTGYEMEQTHAAELAFYSRVTVELVKRREELTRYVHSSLFHGDDEAAKWARREIDAIDCILERAEKET